MKNNVPFFPLVADAGFFDNFQVEMRKRIAFLLNRRQNVLLNRLGKTNSSDLRTSFRLF